MKHLTLTQRYMIEKYIAFEYSFREIAECLNISPSEPFFLIIAEMFLYVIVNMLIGMLSGIEMHYVSSQYLSLMTAAESCNLSDKIVGFLVRYEARSLNSVYENLEFGQAEAAILYVIRILFADLDLHYLIALYVEYIYISCDSSAVCCESERGKMTEQGLGRYRVFGVGVLLQDFQQLDNSQLLVDGFWHRFILLRL